MEFWIEFGKTKKEKKRKKKEEKKKSSKWLVAGVIFFLIFIVGPEMLYQSTVNDIPNFYFYTLFPKIGTNVLEQEYKKNFNDSAITMEKANALIDESVKTAKTSGDIDKEIATLKNYFSQRDVDYQSMIRLDKKALSLNLPTEYKYFYTKRLQADTLDYQAFIVYKTTEEKMMAATYDMAAFEDSYDAANNEFHLTAGHVSEINVRTMADLVQQTVVAYQKIAGDADTTGNFSQGILDYIQRQYEIVGVMQGLVDGYGTKNEQEIAKASDMLATYINNPPPDVASLMNEWWNQMALPTAAKQDAMHKKAWEMYSDAYAFAKKYHLYSITNAWGDNLPTADKEYSPKSTSQYNS